MRADAPALAPALAPDGATPVPSRETTHDELMRGAPTTGAPVMIGLVLTLASRTPFPSSLLAELHRRPGLRLGETRGHWLPATAETGDPRGLHRWLESLPGVRAVDVVFVEVAPAFESGGRSRHAQETNEAGLSFLTR